MFVEGAEKKKIFWSDIEVSSGDGSGVTSGKKQRTEGEVGVCSALVRLCWPTFLLIMRPSMSDTFIPCLAGNCNVTCQCNLVLV
jgi:hypothetical protein